MVSSSLAVSCCLLTRHGSLHPPPPYCKPGTSTKIEIARRVSSTLRDSPKHLQKRFVSALPLKMPRVAERRA
jgi:hypothetical protein